MSSQALPRAFTAMCQLYCGMLEAFTGKFAKHGEFDLPARPADTEVRRERGRRRDDEIGPV